MTQKRNVLSDLDSLIKKASEKKQEVLAKAAAAKPAKQAQDISSALDTIDDGTKPATTGEQAAVNKDNAGNIGAAAVDSGAKDNTPNASVETSTDGAKAVSTDGQSGATGGEIGPVSDTTTQGDVKSAAEQARKVAAELRKQAAALLSPLDHYLVKSARAVENKDMRKVAQEMSEDDLAGQASDALMQGLESGEISDEEAAQILQDAMAEGAITEDDLAQAQQMIQGGEGAPAGDPAAAPAAEAGAAPAGEEMVSDPAMEAKLASADIGPSHPKYAEKLLSLYPEDVRAAYEFGIKLAEEIAEAGEEKEDKAEAEAAAATGEGAETPAEEKKEDEAGDAAEEAAGAAPAGEMPAMMPGADAGVIPGPQSADEAQALAAVQQELGLNDQQLQELMAAPMPAPETKLAAAKAAYRAALLAKVAAFQK